MIPRDSLPRILFYSAGAAILLIGLLTAAFLYWHAGNLPEDSDAGGTVYLADPADSKMYRHELERFGGKAAVFADDLNRWFSGLWEGRGLARTVAILSIVLALGLFRAGRGYRSPSDDDSP